MKTMKTNAGAALLIALVISLAGCQFLQSVGDVVEPSVDTPRKRWAAAEMAYQQTAETLTAQVETSRYDLEELEKIKHYNQLARRSLDAWDEALTNGDDPAQQRRTFDQALDILKDLAMEEIDD